MKAEHLGYMRQPFDTSNYLFFSLLKSACTTEEENEKLTNLFVGYKMHDIEENKKNLTKSCRIRTGSLLHMTTLLYQLGHPFY